MPKFSIVIPVFNTDKYLNKCIDSIINQSYKDYEMIAVNEGSSDKSQDIIDSYGEKIKSIHIIDKNTVGPSYSRNVGVSKATGDYILFLDSDDYYELDLLYRLSQALDKDYDLVRFEIQYDKNGVKEQLNGCQNECIYDNGVSAFNGISNYSIVESPCCYAFNRKFFLKNKFEFKINTLHEDFGLIPLIILKSNSVKCIDYVGYNYVIHDNSIMTNNKYDRVLKKCNDFLEHYKFLKEEGSKISGDLSIFNSYISNSVILKSTYLNHKDYKDYIKKVRETGAFDMLLSDSFGRKVKKFLIRINPRLYYKLVRR